ncbi:MAG: HRDC domain-containing protein, partial [Myxococcales bacterium]|nr:HRDC domain-containing protein [Myxococcales bacterium]
DLVRPEPERMGALRMTEAARPVLRGESEVHLRADSVEKARARPEVRALVSDEDAPLLSALKAKRRALAEAAGVPPYVIFNDKSMCALAAQLPSDEAEFMALPGLGPGKWADFGDAVVELLAPYRG